MEPSNYPQEQSKPSYEYLITYKQSVEIERLTDKFCQVYLDPFKDRRYIEQMNSSARSMPRNIVEGYTRLGLKDYIEFLSFARASGEELLKKVYSGRRLYGKSCFKKKKTSRFLGNEFKIIFPSKYLFFYKSGYRNILIVPNLDILLTIHLQQFIQNLPCHCRVFEIHLLPFRDFK